MSAAAVAAAEGVRLDWLLEPWMTGAPGTPGTQALADAPRAVVHGVAADSRRVRPGDLFAALAGGTTHGLAYMDEVLVRGAAAVVWEPAPGAPAEYAEAAARRAGIPMIPMKELSRYLGALAARFWGDPSRALKVVAVTGTDGKTSVTHYVAGLLSALEPGAPPPAVIGTLGYGAPGALVPTAMTTPDAAALQYALAQCRDAGHRTVALEASSHALDQHRLAGTEVDVAVLTHIGRDHLDYHGTVEHYAAAKARLFADGAPGVPVLNLDDPWGRRWATRGDVLTYSADGKEADLRATALRPTAEGLEMEVAWRGGAVQPVRLALMGRFNAANALAAAGAAIALGYPGEAVVDRLAALTPVPGRMERFTAPGRPLVVVDYAHTPEALRHVLEALRGHCRGCLTAVFGCGGDRDRGKRPLMGRVAAERADAVVLTDDNPRSEDGDAIVAEIAAGMGAARAPRIVRDRAEAIAWAVERAGPGDVVLVAGKGHESEQETAGVRRPFSDRETVMAILDAAAPEGPWSR